MSESTAGEEKSCRLSPLREDPGGAEGAGSAVGKGVRPVASHLLSLTTRTRAKQRCEVSNAPSTAGGNLLHISAMALSTRSRSRWPSSSSFWSTENPRGRH